MPETIVPTQADVTAQFESLFERSSLYRPTFTALSEVVVKALSDFQEPEFDERADVAESFSALFDEENILGWLKWLDMRLQLDTNANISLQEANAGDYRDIIGGYIKGSHHARIMTDKARSQRQLIVFSVDSKPIEVYSLPAER